MSLVTRFLGAAPQQAAGVELAWLGGERWQAHACQLRRAGSVVTVERQLAGLTDLPALLAALGPEPGPLALVVTGRGLVLRGLPMAADAPTAAQLAGLLPGANLADFYWQYAAGPAGTLVALVRQAPLGTLLDDWAAAGLWVLDVQLGPLGAGELLPYLPAGDRARPLPAGPYLLTLAPDGQSLAGAIVPGAGELPTRDFQFGEQVVPGSQLLAYAAALALLTGGPTPAVGRPAELPALVERRREWAQRRWFYRLRLAVPVGILLLLLANLLASQYLQDRQDALAGAMGGNQQLLTRVRAAQRAVAQQQAFLTATGWTRPSVNSLCADRLAATLPAGIQLLVVDISPSQTLPGEAGRGPRFRANVVTVKGQCASAQQFNAWLQRLTRQPWARAVRDQHFAYDYAGGQGTFTFTLQLNANEFEAE